MFADGFGGVVADAAGAAEEEHCGGDVGCEDHGVVTCAAGHGFRGKAFFLQSQGELRGEGYVHGDGGLVHSLVEVHVEMAAMRNGVGLGNEGFEGGEANGIACVTEIESDLNSARDDVGGVGFGLDFADGSYE